MHRDTSLEANVQRWHKPSATLLFMLWNGFQRRFRALASNAGSKHYGRGRFCMSPENFRMTCTRGCGHYVRPLRRFKVIRCPGLTLSLQPKNVHERHCHMLRRSCLSCQYQQRPTGSRRFWSTASAASHAVRGAADLFFLHESPMLLHVCVRLARCGRMPLRRRSLLMSPCLTRTKRDIRQSLKPTTSGVLTDLSLPSAVPVHPVSCLAGTYEGPDSRNAKVPAA